MIGKKVLCYVSENSEIKGVGGSTMMQDKNGKITSNLILDQWGKLMTGIFFGRPQESANINIKDEFGTTRTTRVYLTGSTFITNIIGQDLGVVHRLGSGTTTPARTDFGVATSFGTSPEDSNINALNGTWDSPTGTFKSASAISSGGAGTINEVVLKAFYNSLANSHGFSLFRDIISPGQAFTAGQLLTLEYTVQL